MRGVKSMSDGIYTSDSINAVSIAIGAASASATAQFGEFESAGNERLLEYVAIAWN